MSENTNGNGNHLQKQGGGGGGRRGNQRHPKGPPGVKAALAAAPPSDVYECLICASPIDLFGVFECGHFSCAVCALRIINLTDRRCPVCRHDEGKQIFVTSMVPKDESSFDLASFQPGTASSAAAAASGSSSSGAAAAEAPVVVLTDKTLKCQVVDRVNARAILRRLEKLYGYFCPCPECWTEGEQEAFAKFERLREHMSTEHSKLRYCQLCLDHRPVFMCEQLFYTPNEFDAHNRAKCRCDAPSFQGHPLCLFCNNRFYDGEALLKHMLNAHFTCDMCNRGEFTFVFYKNRMKLDEHFHVAHKVCNHKDCAQLDPMLRVYANDLELQAHQGRAHGQSQRGQVSLESLGFTFGRPAPVAPPPSGRGGVTPPPSASDGGGGGAAHAPATASNAHAVKIYFDQVTHGMEEVNVLPTTTRQRDEPAEGEGRGAGSIPSLCAVLPTHYEPRGVRARGESSMQALPPPPPARASPAASPSPSPSGAAGAAAGRRRGGAAEVGAAAGETATSRTAAAAVPATGAASDARATAGGDDDNDHDGDEGADAGPPPESIEPKEHGKLLKQKLSKYLPQPERFAEFRQLSADFLSNAVLATEYYRALPQFFHAAALEDVFWNLAYSLPNETKREALVAARKMLTSKEAKQRAEAAQQQRDAEIKAQRQAAKQTLGGVPKNKKPAPSDFSATPALGAAMPATSSLAAALSSAARGAALAASAAPAGDNHWSKREGLRVAPELPAASAGSRGGGWNAPALPAAYTSPTSGSSAAARAGAAAFVDPNDFPSLGGPARQTAPRGAWRPTAAGGTGSAAAGAAAAGGGPKIQFTKNKK